MIEPHIPVRYITAQGADFTDFITTENPDRAIEVVTGLSPGCTVAQVSPVVHIERNTDYQRWANESERHFLFG